MDYVIRDIKDAEIALLNTFLYEAIYILEGVDAPPKSIIYFPELQVYVSGFGMQKHDSVLIAEIDGMDVGAVWVRIINDNGYVDEDTPSFSIFCIGSTRDWE